MLWKSCSIKNLCSILIVRKIDPEVWSQISIPIIYQSFQIRVSYIQVPQKVGQVKHGVREEPIYFGQVSFNY